MSPRSTVKLAAANTPLMTKIAIGKISEMLVTSPNARAEFAKNPSAFFETRFGIRPEPVETEFLEDLKEQIADGFCCGGCACGEADPGDTVTLPDRVGGIR